MHGNRDHFFGADEQDLRAACADSGCSVCLSRHAHDGAERQLERPPGAAATLAREASAGYPFRSE